MNKYYRYPSLQYWGDGKDLGFTALFEEDRLKYSESGKFLADSRSCRYLYTGFDDPKYIAFWEEMGCHMGILAADDLKACVVERCGRSSDRKDRKRADEPKKIEHTGITELQYELTESALI